MAKVSVVFVSSVFDEVREGPAIYARYLDRYFTDSEQVDFHLVVPSISQPRRNVHTSGFGKTSLETYTRLQSRALEVASSLGHCIVHGNSAHSMWMFLDYSGPLLVQVNDYDPADVLKNTWKFFRARLLRRYLVLVWRRYHEQQVLRRADRTICNSEYTKAALLRSYTISEARMQVVYKAVDTDAFSRPVQQAEDPHPQRALGKRLIFVGTNWRRKGLEVLMQALLIARDKHPDISVDLVGPQWSELSAELKQFIEKNSLKANLYLSGSVSREDLPRHFWYSDLCALPSHQEALGVSILEALAAGVPVVASNVGGIPEILKGQKCGELVQAGNSALFSKVITGLLLEPDRLKEMGVAGVERASEFGVAKMLLSIEKIYLQHKV